MGAIAGLKSMFFWEKNGKKGQKTRKNRLRGRLKWARMHPSSQNAPEHFLVKMEKLPSLGHEKATVLAQKFLTKKGSPKRGQRPLWVQ